MAEWEWFAGEPRGRCAGCGEPLRRSAILVAWRGGVYDVHCLLDVLTRIAPPVGSYHSYRIPGADMAP